MAALCKLSAMAVDNEKLISCVASRTSLWLATHKDHKNRQVKDALWKEVGQIMYPGKASKECITALQKRWKFLRDKFRRLFVLAQKKKKSGMGTEDADSDTEDEGDEGNPPADSPVQPAS
ncbi:hypothetical protein MRX96_059869 [Rhipicephalus microplus]